MFGMVVLDVSIGLIFFYLLFSLIGSAVAESIELVLRARARTLAEGIRSILFDVEGKGMAGAFYEHPLIRTLRREDRDLPRIFKAFSWLGAKLKGRKSGAEAGSTTLDISRYNLPSYIPSELFFTALMDTLVNGDARRADPAAPAPAAQRLELEKVLTAIDALAKDPRQGESGKQLGRVLRALLPEGAQELSAFQARVESWFNGSMDRVSGWYKQRTQWVLFLIGLLTAGLMNADSIRIAQVLARDRTLRESVVAMAQQQRQLPAAAAPDTTRPPTGEELQAAFNNVSAGIGKVHALGLPLGWDEEGEDLKKLGEAQGSEWWLLIALKALGFLASAVAVALGAPFWFDLLNKFMVVRSTVKPEEKSRKEGSKDG